MVRGLKKGESSVHRGWGEWVPWNEKSAWWCPGVRGVGCLPGGALVGGGGEVYSKTDLIFNARI